MVKTFPTTKQLFALHGWLGLHFGLWLFVVCFSGAIATLTHEIEWLTDPALRVQREGLVQWQKTYEALARAYPNAQIYGFGASETSVMDTLAWESYITHADGRWGQVRVDPYRGEIVRASRRLYLTDYIRQLHYNTIFTLASVSMRSVFWRYRCYLCSAACCFTKRGGNTYFNSASARAPGPSDRVRIGSSACGHCCLH